MPLEGAPRQLPLRHLTHYPLLWQSEQAYIKENIALVLVIRLGYISKGMSKEGSIWLGEVWVGLG